jgi:hypothetical protein
MILDESYILEQFLLSAYEGDKGFRNTTLAGTAAYLKQHPRENDDKFNRRRATCVYTNFCRTIIDIYMGYLSRIPPERGNLNDVEMQFIENANAKGISLNAVLSEFQRLALILDEVYIIVDRPIDLAVTAAEEKIPYLAMRTKSQVIAGSVKYDAMGELTEIAFRELLQDGTYLTRKYTLDGWSVDRDIYNDGITSGKYNFNRVPVVRLKSAPTTSFFSDIANQSLKLFNLESEVDSLLSDQTFSILYMHFPDVETMERVIAGGGLKLGTENGLGIVGGSPPGFISPDGTNVSLYLERISGIAGVITNIYRAACLEFLASGQLSGEALALLFNQLNSRLSSIAMQFEIAEKQIFQLVNLWMNTESEIEISYNKNFNIKSLPIELENSGIALGMNIGSETFKKEVQKRVAKQVLDDLSAEKMQLIEEEIESSNAYNESVDLNAADDNLTNTEEVEDDGRQD